MTWTPQAIRSLRERLGFTQEKLAAAVDVHIATVAAWERGTHRPSRMACRILGDLDRTAAPTQVTP